MPEFATRQSTSFTISTPLPQDSISSNSFPSNIRSCFGREIFESFPVSFRLNPPAKDSPPPLSHRRATIKNLPILAPHPTLPSPLVYVYIPLLAKNIS